MRPEAELSYRFTKNIIIKTEINEEGYKSVEYKDQKIVNQTLPEELVKIEEEPAQIIRVSLS